eukprot:scaffold48603_cov19-Tisochrysis_lutea.AAC.2
MPSIRSCLQALHCVSWSRVRCTRHPPTCPGLRKLFMKHRQERSAQNDCMYGNKRTLSQLVEGVAPKCARHQPTWPRAVWSGGGWPGMPCISASRRACTHLVKPRCLQTHWLDGPCMPRTCKPAVAVITPQGFDCPRKNKLDQGLPLFHTGH